MIMSPGRDFLTWMTRAFGVYARGWQRKRRMKGRNRRSLDGAGMEDTPKISR